MSQKQETPNLIKTFIWEEFKLQLDKRCTPHHLVLQNGTELLKPTQGDDKGSFATYIRDFNFMLNVVHLKNEYVGKFIFMHGLRP
jgi:hypothetical protein